MTSIAIARNVMFLGTFLVALIVIASACAGTEGPEGDTGPAGDIGAQGPQGAQGAQGDRGPQGAQGVAGVRGAEGTAGGTTSAESATDAAPTIVISPPGVLKEGQVTINGAGFGAGQSATITVLAAGPNGADLTMGTANANSSGAFSQTFALDAGIAVGVWTVSADGAAFTPMIVISVPK